MVRTKRPAAGRSLLGPGLGPILGSVSIAALVLAGCANGDTAAVPAPEPTASADAGAEVDVLDPCSRPNLTTVEPGALTFATSDVPAPPFFLTDEPADRLGLESDLAYAIAERMGFRPQEVTWEFVSPDEVVTGRFVDYDIAIGGFTPRSEQFPAVAYTRPYAELPLTLVTTTDEVPAVLQGVRSSGEGTEEGAGAVRTPDQLAWAATFQGPGPPWLIEQGWMEFDTRYEWARGGISVEGALDLADVVVVDEPTLSWLTEVGDVDFSRIAGVEVPTASLAMAMVAGNPLLACVDRAVGEMSEEGELSDVLDRWTNPDSWTEE